MPPIARLYDDFLAAFAGGSTADPLAATIELVHAWRRFPWTDPDLPRELLPPAVDRRPGRGALSAPARAVVTRGEVRLAPAH